MDKDTGKLRSLGELPLSLDPPHDLWPQIEARLRPPAAQAVASRRIPWRSLAAAAMVASLAVGMFIGRDLLPGHGTGVIVPGAAPGNTGTMIEAAYVSDPRYQRDRARLLQSLQSRLEALPPPAQAKVRASLATIQGAKHDLEQALGKDPSNALLQELLINTYQDEMRVLADVHEASDAGKGI